MTTFDECLSTLVKLASADGPASLAAARRSIEAYLAAPHTPRDVGHPCDQIAEAFMKLAPDTEAKGHILDLLFNAEHEA
jgi:hypothetical protein